MAKFMTKLITRKTYQQNGKWVERPGKTLIVVCVCGNKYIKTRENQTLCVRCIGQVVVTK
jgi:hypothetical protein